MKERRYGKIVNIASIAGRSGTKIGPYGASKAGVINLTHSSAIELAPFDINVNAICPGLVKTKFSRALWENEEILKRAVENLPLRRIAEPDEIAPLAVLLASDASGFSTGGVYTIDGGRDI